QGTFIEETIKSILSQNYPALEYIIIDGGSTDGSVDIIRRYESELTSWVSESDTGFGHAINKGFARSTGEILGWVNSDDLLLPGALEFIGKYFQKYEETGLIFGNRYVIDASSAISLKRDYVFYLPGQFKFAKTLPQESTFWRREVFVKAGPLDENLDFAVDFDLWCRISKCARIRHVPFFLGAFRDQTGSKSANISHVGIEERDRIILKYFNHYPNKLMMKSFQGFLGITRRLYRFAGLSILKRVFINHSIR
ncbi:MAG TPA: glycosyltransferase family 2 protein, partial [Chryseolinea sp.]|nr:glycosyltransferase family 2 protein [Chryseolinea sp.]